MFNFCFRKFTTLYNKLKKQSLEAKKAMKEDANKEEKREKVLIQEHFDHSDEDKEEE